MNMPKILSSFFFLLISFSIYNFTCSQNQTQSPSPNQGSTQTPADRSTDSSMPVEQPKSGASIEEAVLIELNRARTNPKNYANKIRAELKNNRRNQQMVNDINECIRFLETTSAIHALKLSKGMSRAALDHVKDQGPKGAMGHESTDGTSFFDRMLRYGKVIGYSAENISYGYDDAEKIVFQLLVDHNVPSRGHRKNIFGKNYYKVGIAVGKHSRYRYMCVMNFAQDFKEKN